MYRTITGGSMPISVRFEEEIEQRLTRLAKLTGRTKTYYIRQAVQEKLDDLEDRYIAEHRLEHPTERLSLEAVRQALALDD
jgi:RHH-type transcriptional regulator, rel operon repressor / antitoxin RelB